MGPLCRKSTREDRQRLEGRTEIRTGIRTRNKNGVEQELPEAL
jgi:hypothetical protein